MTQLVPRLRRRAFDLVETIDPRHDRAECAAGPLSDYEAKAAETLMAIARAMAPSYDEIRDIAVRHGLATGDAGTAFLQEPRLAALVAERFPHSLPEPATCRRYFETHADEFRTPDLYEGREILIGGDVTDWDWRGEAYGRAERIVAMLHYDRRVFKDLLIYSSAASRVRDGKVGPVSLGGWDSEVAAPFFSLKPGDVFPLPVPSSQGFHILLMDHIESGWPRSFAEAEADVVRRLGMRARLKAAVQHLATLRDGLGVAE